LVVEEIPEETDPANIEIVGVILPQDEEVPEAAMMDTRDARDELKPDGESPKSKSKKKIKKKKKSKKSKSNKDNVEKDGAVLAITVDESEPNQSEVLLLVAEEESQTQEAALLLVTDDQNNAESGEIIVIDNQSLEAAEELLSRQSSRGQPHVVILEVPKEEYTPVNYEVVLKPDESIVVENGETVVPDNTKEIIIISVPEEERAQDEEDLVKKKRKKKKSKSRHNLNQQALDDILAHEQEDNCNGISIVEQTSDTGKDIKLTIVPETAQPESKAKSKKKRKSKSRKKTKRDVAPVVEKPVEKIAPSDEQSEKEDIVDINAEANTQEKKIELTLDEAVEPRSVESHVEEDFDPLLQKSFVPGTSERLREKSRDLVRALSSKKHTVRQASTSREKENKPKDGLFKKVFRQFSEKVEKSKQVVVSDSTGRLDRKKFRSVKKMKQEYEKNV